MIIFVYLYFIKKRASFINNAHSFKVWMLTLTQCVQCIKCMVLKGSYDVAKKNIIFCIWCNAVCTVTDFCNLNGILL